MIKELKDFLFRGNVLDLAVAVVMGAAFNAIITSLVSDIITPVILNPVVKAANVENLSKLSWNGIAYGSFLSAVINFLVIGTVLFFVVKAANHAVALGKKKEATEEARQYMLPFPPSSPSIALFKDGELVHMIERHHIEGHPAGTVFIALAQVSGTEVIQANIAGRSRGDVREIAVLHAFNLVRKALLSAGDLL